MSLANQIQKAGDKLPGRRRSEPLWRGPSEDGITFSMLSRFLCCRERFRLMVVEGLRPADSFNHKIEYGQMWHVCEESYASHDAVASKGPAAKMLADNLWKARLSDYCKQLCQKYRTQQEQIDHWYNVCKVQFPKYVQYWSTHEDMKNRTPLLQEQIFSVPYKLPSGRVVKLRGKWDSVDLVGNGTAAGIWLMENKTKGQINEQQLQRQLTFDLQTMMYLVALQSANWDADRGLDGCSMGRGGFLTTTGSVAVRSTVNSRQSCTCYPILGVRYNVIRRPLSGGAGTIRQHKPTKSNPQGEGKEDFYARVAQYIKDQPQDYFFRWNVAVSQKDIERFRRECLDPILEQLCDWWNWIQDHPSPFIMDIGEEFTYYGIHWRHPYGVWSPMDNGAESDLDEYLVSGSEIGLQRVDKLFGELE